MKINEIPTPFYIVYEDRLRRNLELINRVKREAEVNIIMAFKANALGAHSPSLRNIAPHQPQVHSMKWIWHSIA